MTQTVAASVIIIATPGCALQAGTDQGLISLQGYFSNNYNLYFLSHDSRADEYYFKKYFLLFKEVINTVITGVVYLSTSMVIIIPD